MKSSTLHRSSISKERIAALEELLSDKSSSYDSSPGVYVRSDKDRELDILWQGFKLNAREERSPGVYLTIGFITGAICMFLMTTILNFGTSAHENSFIDLNLWKKANTPAQEKTMPVSVTPASQASATAANGTATTGRMEKYAIQSGDTMEKVAIKYYGTATPENIQKIQAANKLTDPNKISIGQELTIPIEN